MDLRIPLASTGEKRQSLNYRRSAMPHLTTLLAFAAVAFAMVLTPGPNMAYLVSRSMRRDTPPG